MFRYAVLLVCLALVAAKSGKNSKRLAVRQASCAVNEFTCKNGRCIEDEYSCDTEDDCGDNSDETDPSCPPMGQCTGSHEVACKNGQCVPLEYRCDGDDDCGDNTDEADCPSFECTSGEFKCTNGLCIEHEWLCDGDDDCKDGSDELKENCPA